MQLKSTCRPLVMLSHFTIQQHYAPNWFNCLIACLFWAKSVKYCSKKRGKLMQLWKERAVIALGFYLIRGELQLHQTSVNILYVPANKKLLFYLAYRFRTIVCCFYPLLFYQKQNCFLQDGASYLRETYSPEYLENNLRRIPRDARAIIEKNDISLIVSRILKVPEWNIESNLWLLLTSGRSPIIQHSI